jgi:Chromo (CHRromatin Organisation MOdifier) domain
MATMPNSEIGGLSPIELKFGSSSSKYFLLPDNLGPGHSYSEYITALDQDLATVRSITAKYQLELRERRQQLHPERLQNIYQPGDMIFWNPKEHAKSFRSTKLAPKLLGPYVVIKQLANDISCRHMHSNTDHVFHSSRVSPYIGSDVSAKKISMLDTEEYVVESITAHRGSWKRLSSMEFLVNWSGYTAADSTWERWTNVRDVKALHQYLINIGLEKHIPNSHRHSSCHPQTA